MKYLVALAKYRHFGKAAKACFVSQPTLSIQLNKLEKTLGVRLFERTQKRVLITPIGIKVIGQAQVVLDASNKLEQLAKLARDPFSAALHLGFIPTLGPYILPYILPYLKQALPRLGLFLFEEKTDALLEQLSQGKLDAIILALPVPQRGLQVRALFKEPFFLVLPLSHPLRDKKRLDLKDLKKDTLLLLEEGHCLRKQALEICHERGFLKEDMHYRATSLETLRHMVASGAGMTLLPLLAFEQWPLVINKTLSPPVPKRSIGMLWRKGSVLTPCCEKIADLIVNHVPRILANLERQLEMVSSKSHRVKK